MNLIDTFIDSLEEDTDKVDLKDILSKKEDLYLWEANSLYSSVSKAYEIAFGKALIPRIELSHASIIVSR